MNIEQYLKLIDAGFTADEIRAMVTGETTGPDKTTGTAENIETDVTTAPAAPAAPVASVETTGDNGFATLNAKLDELSNQLRKVALLGAVQPTSTPDVLDDYLASVINPRHKEAK